MPSPALLSWTTTISSLVRNGHATAALREFSLMCNSGLRPNEFGFSLALKASSLAADMTVGKLLHGCSIKSGYESYSFCSTSILDMYTKTGCMTDARSFFNATHVKCESLWNTMIAGCTRVSDSSAAFGLFHHMLLSDAIPNSFTYAILVKLCSATDSHIDLVKFCHCRTIKVGLDMYNYVGAALVDVYTKWGELSDACRLFEGLEEPDHVVWNVLLTGLHRNGEHGKGLDLYLRFASDGDRLDQFMLVTLFNICSDLETPGLGLQMHSCLVKLGFPMDSFIGSALVDMYAAFGMVTDAHRCFIHTIEKNEVIFSVMIQGFVYDSDYSIAIGLVHEMRKQGLKLNCSTLNSMLRAYAGLGMLEEGRVVHGYVLKTFGWSDLVIGNSLIDMYAKCRAMDKAENSFAAAEVRNEFSWTTLISGYIELGRNENSLELFRAMQSSDSVKPNQFTLVAILGAISRLTDLYKGKQIHGYAIKFGFQSYAYVESALIEMYSECDCLIDATQTFKCMTHEDLVSWSTMMSAYVQHGHGERALNLIFDYSARLVTVDEYFLTICLSACSSVATLGMGRCVHAISIKAGFESNSEVCNATIDMYSKCGSIGDAHKTFSMMRERNAVCYTAMVCGYAHHGLGQEALHLFREMLETGFEPDNVTFIGVLSACNHFGLVKEGWHYFESMRKDYRLERTMSHYACMVDLLGRAGQVSEAEELINMAPFQPKTSLWRALLGACNKHGNIEAGTRIAQMLIRLEPGKSSTYVSLSNMYASASLWAHSIEVKNKAKGRRIRKTPGYSWIEVSN